MFPICCSFPIPFLAKEHWYMHTGTYTMFMEGGGAWIRDETKNRDRGEDTEKKSGIWDPEKKSGIKEEDRLFGFIKP